MTRNQQLIAQMRVRNAAEDAALAPEHRAFRATLCAIETAWPRLTREEKDFHGDMCRRDMTGHKPLLHHRMTAEGIAWRRAAPAAAC